MVRLEVSGNDDDESDFFVSIPIWCDWKVHTRNVIRFGLRVSIPIWCDWKNIFWFECFAVQTVSIPIWCDWKSRFYGNKVLVPQFQFLYGAIGSG